MAFVPHGLFLGTSTQVRNFHVSMCLEADRVPGGKSP